MAARNPKRTRQDVIIVLAILLVLLVLWWLKSSWKYGGMAGAAAGHVFGQSTIGLFASGAGTDMEERPPPGSSNDTEAIVVTDAPPPAPVAAAAPRSPAGGLPPPPPSTNFVNTNGPVTVIAIPPSDWVATPPGVVYAPSLSESSTIEKRLGAAGAQGGEVQISLYWNDYCDLDLHCVDPGGDEIMYLRPVSPSTGGRLDVDRNARPPFTKTPVENIFWPEHHAPAGLYRVTVVYYSPRQGVDGTVPAPFTVRVQIRGHDPFYFRSNIRYDSPRVAKAVCAFEFDPRTENPDQRIRFVR